MNKGTYVVVLVPSTSHALRAEKVLHMAGIDSKLIPVPRSVSSDCGVCVRIRAEDRQAAADVLEKHKIAHKGIVYYT